MTEAEILNNEEKRIEELNDYEILDTLPEEEYDNIIYMASKVCKVPIALLSFLDKDRQWFKSKIGVEVNQTSRDVSFCTHAINELDEILEISDTSKDERFSDNPLGTENPNIMFYAGIPVKSHSGIGLGTICVMDYQPKKLDIYQREALASLSKQMGYILDHRLKNLKIREERIQLETVFENTDGIIFELNKKGEFTYVNRALINTFGSKKSDLIGKKFTDFIKGKSKKERVEHRFNTQLKELQPSCDYEFSFKEINLDITHIQLTIKLILKNQNRISSIVALARDVTASKKNDVLLRRLSAVAETTTNAVLVLDKRNNIEWVNDSFEATFGYSLDDVKGKDPGSFLNGKLTDLKVIAKIKKKIAINEFIKTELINYHKDGTPRWIGIVMNPVFDENKKLLNYVCIEQDITDRKEKQEIIDTQYRGIYSSIEYAKRIQNALIPSEEQFFSLYKDSFALYKPKDVVSGDFYMANMVEIGKNKVAKMYAVADCTGHGVPGAMLSVLCYSILMEAVKLESLDDPGMALSYAKERLKSYLNTDIETEMYDGMDISICIILPHKNLIQFAGANLPLYRIRGNEVNVFKGSRQSVGLSRKDKPFKTEVFSYEKGDKLYMFSDGIIDQFGGEKDKKFMSKRLKTLLLSMTEKEMKEQKELINNEFQRWKGDTEQTDDVCLIGISL